MDECTDEWMDAWMNECMSHVSLQSHKNSNIFYITAVSWNLQHFIHKCRLIGSLKFHPLFQSYWIFNNLYSTVSLWDFQNSFHECTHMRYFRFFPLMQFHEKTFSVVSIELEHSQHHCLLMRSSTSLPACRPMRSSTSLSALQTHEILNIFSITTVPRISFKFFPSLQLHKTWKNSQALLFYEIFNFPNILIVF